MPHRPLRGVCAFAGLALLAMTAAGCNLPAGSAAAPTGTPTLTLPPVLPTTEGPPTQPPTLMPTATPPPTEITGAPDDTPPSATPTEPPLPTEEVSGLPATPADVLITDNFDVPSLEWYAYADDASSSGQEGGIYFVSMNVNGRWTWRLGPVNSATKDIVIQADARLANDDPGGVYGFICRYDSATQSFYNFALTGDSRYRIARVNNGGDWTFLMDFGEPSPVVNPATQWNQIEVGCVSETLWLRVNGVMLASVNDAALANTGDFGFWAQTRGGAPQARAEYDFLTVRALAP